jgi:hypothetical protein
MSRELKGWKVEDTCLRIWGDRIWQEKNRQENYHGNILKKAYEHFLKRSFKNTQDK